MRLALLLCLASCTLAEAGASPHAERIAAAQATYEAQLAAHTAGEAVASGMAPARDAEVMRYFVAEAKVWSAE